MWNAYLALGDSASKGVGDDIGAIRCQSWTCLVAETLALSRPDLRYKNVAYRGATAAGVLRMQVPVIAEFHPDLVSLTVGANDARDANWTPAQFTRELSAILEAIADAGAEPMVATYPDIRSIFDLLGQQIRPKWQPYFDRVAEVNQTIRAVGANFEAYLVDLEHSPASTDPQYLSGDFTHPNALGYRLAAETALEALDARVREAAR